MPPRSRWRAWMPQLLVLLAIAVLVPVALSIFSASRNGLYSCQGALELPEDAVLGESSDLQPTATVRAFPPALTCSYATSETTANGERARVDVHHDLGTGWLIASGALAAAAIATLVVQTLRPSPRPTSD